MRFKNLMACAAMAAVLAAPAYAEHLVILHTNDTHSQIKTNPKTNLGGVLRRKAAIDSVRAAEKNVILADAGDFVQGSLYFYLYGGKVEQQLLNDMGYDFSILGNHEFDLGADSMAKVLANSKATLLSTNYDMTGTPFDGMFKPVAVREIDGKRIGFLAINLRPDGMIAKAKTKGVRYEDGIQAANAAAWWLRHVEHCDMVIALTHIGYSADPSLISDIDLAKQTRGIDLIIGGHSHSLVVPGNPDMPNVFKNLDGKDVIIAQTGRYGANLGKIDIDLDTKEIKPEMIAMDSHFDAKIDQAVAQWLEPYTAGVDSLYKTPLFVTSEALPQGSPQLKNFVSDFVYDLGTKHAKNIDFALVNDGGMRNSLPEGVVGEGHVRDVLPFHNTMAIVDMKGSDLIELLGIMAKGSVTSVSKHLKGEFVPPVRRDGVTVSPAVVKDVTINGKPIDPNRTYRIATIDYLAEGNDYLTPMKRTERVYTDPVGLDDRIVQYYQSLKKSKRKVNPDNTVRFKAVKQ